MTKEKMSKSGQTRHTATNCTPIPTCAPTPTIMPLRTERLRVEQLVAQNTKQFIVNGSVPFPTELPVIERVLNNRTEVRWNRIETIPDKVVLDGTLSVEFLYVGEHQEHRIHTFRTDVDFLNFVDMPGILPEMNVDIIVEIEDVSTSVNPDNCEEQYVHALLKVIVAVTETVEVNALTELPEGVQGTTMPLSVNHVVCSNTKQIMETFEFEEPDDIPGIDRIREKHCHVKINEIRLLKNKLVFDGTIRLRVLYIPWYEEHHHHGDFCDGDHHNHGDFCDDGHFGDHHHGDFCEGEGFHHDGIHEFERNVDFTDFIDLPGADSGMEVILKVMVEHCEVTPVQQPRCKYALMALLNVKAYVTTPKNVNVVTSVTGATPIATTCLRVESPIGEATDQVKLRGVIPTDGDIPGIERVVERIPRDIHFDKKEIIDNKVLFMGYVNVHILYIEAVAERTFRFRSEQVTFSDFVDIPGARPYMNVHIKRSVEYLEVKPDIHCNLVVDGILKLDVRVTQPKEVTLVLEGLIMPTPAPTTAPPTAPPTAAPTTAPPVCVPGTSFTYTVQAGDSLYAIAQRYGTTVNAIINANPQLPNPNQLNVGDVLTVPCVAKG